MKTWNEMGWIEAAIVSDTPVKSWCGLSPLKSEGSRVTPGLLSELLGPEWAGKLREQASNYGQNPSGQCSLTFLQREDWA